MQGAGMLDAKISHHQFEVPIQRPVSDMWRVMVEDINAWWAADFRIFGEGSTISLDATAGGQLLETDGQGGSLEWFRVQMAAPPHKLYLVGYLASDWGGPTISMVKLALTDHTGGCLLSVSDTLLGNTTEKSSQQSMNGWRTLFGDSLKAYAEAQ